MIELSEFRRRRASIEDNIAPHKMVRLDEIRQVENDVYEVGNLDLVFSPRAQRQLVRAIGTNSRQLKSVKGLSGEVGQAYFSNYLSVAKNLAEEKQVVLMANKGTRTVSNVIIPKKDFISVGNFFDFAELLIDTAGYEVEKIESTLTYDMNVIIYLQSRQPRISMFAPEEEFISNGAYLRWNGESIELGNYYVRLVCSNGSIQTIRNRDASIYTMEVDDVNRLLQLASTEAVMEAGFVDFQEKALEAIQTQVSLRELKMVHGYLGSRRVDLPDTEVSSITGYRDNLRRFSERHLEVKGIEERVKTDVSWWNLYNRMTEFATHSNALDQDDARRGLILNYATEQLFKTHDIISYIE